MFKIFIYKLINILFKDVIEVYLMSIKNSMIAGSLATIICNPLDNIRVNIQTKNISSMTSIKYIYGNYGIKGFYRGIGLGLITVPTFWSIYFPCYEYFKNYHSIPLSAYTSCCIASTITSPLWYIRQKRQTFTEFDPLHEIKNLKIRQFYSGLFSTYLINCNFLIQIPIYEKIKQEASFVNNPFNIFLATTFSKVCASMVTFPLENFRVLSRQSPGTSFICIFNKLYYSRGYYNGLTNYLIKSVPYHGIIFCTYEYLRQ